MDAFALARVKARALRERVGMGMRSAIDVVTQALTEEGYGITLEPPASVNLRGDDAQLRRDFSTVLVRNDVPLERRALLAAHELGHLVLHRPQDCCELGSSGIGAGSRALSRVETYGPRERRELQANVFAREFLLPREEARRLFVGECLPASEIAQRVGMPIGEVRRQLLEALLLPDRQPKVSSGQLSVIKLDASQQKAVDFVGRAILIEAGPGSGKTRTLVSRIERRLADGTHPSRILALTFSNAAAAELSDRIAERRPDDAVEVWTGTFHAFGLEVLRLHHERLGLPPEIRLISPSQAVEMLEEHLPLLGLKHFHDLRNPGGRLKEILKAISRAKDEIIGPARFRELAEAGLAEARKLTPNGKTKAALAVVEKGVATAEKTWEAAIVYEVYEGLLQRHSCMDFADLVMRATLLIESDEDVRTSFWDRYSEILVDEYQDVNRACARLLQALHGPETKLWVVGDSRQSIYRFRGASSLNMGRFERDFPGGQRTALEWNYRSSENIVALCRTFAAAMDERQVAGQETVEKRLAYDANAKRGPCGSDTVLHVGLDDACEADLVAKEIKALEAAGVPFGQQAVLARANGRLDTLAAQLVSRGIPVLHLGSFFEREEVRDLLSVISLVAEPNGAALVRLAAHQEVDVHADDIGTIVEHARERNLPLVDILVEAASIPGLGEEAAVSLVRLGTRLAGMRFHTPAFEVAATWLLERSGYLRDLAAMTGIEADLSRAALWQLIEFLDQTEPDGSPLNCKEILRRVRTVVLMADDRDLREPGLGGVDAVRLMTVHASKGLEFVGLHVVGLHEGGFPLGHRAAVCQPPRGIDDGRDPRAAHAEEEDAAFFVAISRAMDHLRLYHTEKAAKAARNRSRFFDDLSVASGERLEKATLLAPAVKPAPELIDAAGLTLFDIQDYETCPLKVAYRHRMRIRSRRYESPFLQASGVLYEVLDRASEIAVAAEDLEASILAVITEVWSERGPSTHSLADGYLALVRSSVARLGDLMRGFRGAPATTVRVPITGGHITVPAPLLSKTSGPVIARFVDLRLAEPKSLRAGMLYAAGTLAAEREASIQVAQLTDGAIIPIVRATEEAKADLAEAAGILAAVRSGALDPRPNMHDCMRCAHFFSCPATGSRRPRSGT